MQKAFKTACGIVCALGLLLMIGAAGGSDTNALSLRQTAWLLLLGLGMFAGGGYLGGIIQ